MVYHHQDPQVVASRLTENPAEVRIRRRFAFSGGIMLYFRPSSFKSPRRRGCCPIKYLRGMGGSIFDLNT